MDDNLELLQKSNFINRNAATKFLCHTINQEGKIWRLSLKIVVKMEVLLVDGMFSG